MFLRWPTGRPGRALIFFFSSRRRHTRLVSDWSSDVCSSDLEPSRGAERASGLGAVRRGPGRGRRPGGARRAATGPLTGCGVNRVVLVDPAGDIGQVAAALGTTAGPRPKLSPDRHLWLAPPQARGRAAAAVARRQAVTAAGADGG